MVTQFYVYTHEMIPPTAIYRGNLDGQIMEEMKTKLHSTQTHIEYNLIAPIQWRIMQKNNDNSSKQWGKIKAARFQADDKHITNNCLLDAMNWICWQLWWEYVNWFQIVLFFYQISTHRFQHQLIQRLIKLIEFFWFGVLLSKFAKKVKKKVELVVSNDKKEKDHLTPIIDEL